MNFCNLIKKIGKKIQNYVKKLIFGGTGVKFAGCHDNVKNGRHTIAILNFRRVRRNSY